LESDDTTLVVNLGQGATVLLNTPIQFKAGLVIERRDEKSSPFDVSENQFALAPVSPPAVQAQLGGPNMIGLCENNFTLDAVTSYGAAARDWSSIRWEIDVTRSNIQSKNASAILKDINTKLAQAKGLSVTIQSETSGVVTLPFGTYAVKLILSNWLGTKGQTTMTVEKKPQALPMVKVSGNQFSIRRSEVLSISLESKKSSCGSVSTVPMSFSWAIKMGSKDADTTGLDLSSSTIAFPAYWFINGQTYSVTGTANQGGSSESSATANVVVQDAPPVAVLSSADQTQPASTDLILDGSGSYDTDISPGNRQTADLLWSWSCKGQSSFNGTDTLTTFCPKNLFNGQAELPQFSKSASVITVATSQLTVGRTYTFTLTVYKCRRQQVNYCADTSKDKWSQLATSSVSTKVHITASNQPIVSVTSSAALFSAEKAVQLIGRADSVDGTQLASFAWSLSPTGLSSSNVDSVTSGSLLDDNMQVDAQYFIERPLVIRPYKLTPGQEYTAKFLVTDAKGRVSSSQTTFRINTPPSSGTFTVKRLLANGEAAAEISGGTALEDTYRLEANKWTDDMDGLSYGFYATNNYTDDADQSQWDVVRVISNNPKYEGKLPSGGSSGQLTLICAVFDVFGDAAYTRLTVSILPPALPTNALAGKLSSNAISIMDNTKSNGDYLQGLSDLSPLASTLDVIGSRRRRQQTAEECQARTNLAETLQVVCKNLPVTTDVELNKVCTLNLDKVCYNMGTCSGPAGNCVAILTRLTESVSAIAVKSVTSVANVADAILGTTGADSRVAAVQRSLQQTANADLATHVLIRIRHSTRSLSFL
jgi:hypothetical protein